MRSLFIAGAKLLGLVFIYRVLMSLLSMLPIVFPGSPQVASSFEKSMLVYMSVSSLVLFCFALLLIFRTEWLADLIKLKVESSSPVISDKSVALRGGVVLIGLYIFATRMGLLIMALYNSLIANRILDEIAATHPQSITFTQDIVSSGLTVAFSLFLIFDSKTVIKLIEKS